MPKILFFILAALLAASCGAPASNAPTNTNPTDVARSGGGKSEQTPIATPANTNATCYQVDTGKKAVLKSQTFAIDFEPFTDSCFVTSHDPEFTDPPLESEFAIYTNGRKVFDFPGQFNGVTVGCWVNAVAFQDVNNDKQTDVVVVGECGAKSGSYHENMVYLNDGKTFVTQDDANLKLSGFKSIKEILVYIKDNPSTFSLSNASPNNRQS